MLWTYKQLYKFMSWQTYNIKYWWKLRQTSRIVSAAEKSSAATSVVDGGMYKQHWKVYCILALFGSLSFNRAAHLFYFSNFERCCSCLWRTPESSTFNPTALEHSNHFKQDTEGVIHTGIHSNDTCILHIFVFWIFQLK